MRRISHDLPGVTSRIAKLSGEYETQIRETQEVWRDAKAQNFFQEQTTEIAPTISQLVATMTQTCELFEEISKRVMDPDVY